jgi:hypothetical protein
MTVAVNATGTGSETSTLTRSRMSVDAGLPASIGAGSTRVSSRYATALTGRRSKWLLVSMQRLPQRKRDTHPTLRELMAMG